MKYKDVHEISYEPRWSEQASALYKGLGWGKSPDAPLFDLEHVDQLMQGAIDTHIHSGPDAYITRVQDDLDIAIQACQAGMGAVVYKCLSAPTARSAKITQKVIDQWAKEHNKESTKVIGGIVLSYAVGGLNPEAVRCTARLGGRVVWTPVVDSSHHHKITGQPGGIEVVDGDKVVPELREIFKIIAKYDMVLALCHHSTRERFIMIDDAKEEGVKRISIVHPTESLVKMSITQMEIAAEKGAYLELCCLDFSEREIIWDEWLEIIKQVGVDHIILGTDVGNWKLPPPVMQYRTLLGRLLESGIPETDIERMAKTNPRKLIFD